MTCTRSVLSACLLVLSSLQGAGALAQLPDGIERVTSVEGITEYRLDNGLEVLLFPDPSKATITVNITYLVGSVHEGYGESGMAHLLEHMLFKGSPRHTDILKELQDRGAQANATTSWEHTNYYETLDAGEQNLEWALDLEADRMINSFVAQEDLDSEMTVVRNEFESSESNSFGVLLYRVLSTGYVWHGYGNPPIGSRSDIENVPIERLQAFYRKHYQPDNAVLVVAGRIDEARTLELIDEHFGAIPRPDRVLEQTYTEEPVQDGEREVVVRRVGNIQAVMAGFHTPAGTHEDFVPLQVAARVLTDAPSGRLYRALVEPGLAAQVAVQDLQLKDPGMQIFIAIVREDGSLETARETLLATLADLARNPIAEAEVTRVKNQALAGLEQQMNDSQAVALQLGNWAAMGDWRLLFLDRDRLRAVTAEHAQRVALEYWKPANRTMGMFIPDAAPDRAEIPPPPDLAALLDGYVGDEARAEGEAFDATHANIDARTIRVELPGGAKLAMLPKETRGDVVHAVIRLNFGDLEGLAGQGAAPGLAAQMLMRGTRTKSRQEIQDELSVRQSQLGIGGGASGTGANIRSTREHLADVLTLAVEVLREPSFPENEFNTLRDAALAGLEFQQSEPQAIVSRAFTRHWTQRYRPDDVRYTPTLTEELEMLRAVTVDDLREFHASFYGASDAEIAIVGDFDPNEIGTIVAELLGDWESPRDYEEVTNPYPEPAIEPIERTFETPDKENSFFLAGMPVRMSTEHADYPAMVLGNYILGQGPASRLFGRIRGDEGLSYGVGSQFQASVNEDGARFLVNAISAPQNTERVEASFRDELATILDKGYTQAEVAAAKQSWVQSREVGWSQDQQLVGALRSNLHFDRTMRWDADLEARVLALTPDEIRAAMRRHLDPDAMAYMKGGDFAGN